MKARRACGLIRSSPPMVIPADGVRRVSIARDPHQSVPRNSLDRITEGGRVRSIWYKQSWLKERLFVIFYGPQKASGTLFISKTGTPMTAVWKRPRFMARRKPGASLKKHNIELNAYTYIGKKIFSSMNGIVPKSCGLLWHLPDSKIHEGLPCGRRPRLRPDIGIHNAHVMAIWPRWRRRSPPVCTQRITITHGGTGFRIARFSPMRGW